MKRVLRVLWLPLIILAALYFGGTYAYKNRIYAPISNLIGDDTKEILRDTVLVFQTKAELETQVSDLQRRLDQNEAVQELLEVALRNNPNLPEEMPFSLVSRQSLNTGRDRFSLVSYESPFIPLSHFGRRAYVETYQDDLLVVTAMGTVGRVPLADIDGEDFSMSVMHTNLPDLIPNPDFYEVNEFSIKDVLVHEGRLLISYSKMVTDGCYTLAIAAADMQATKLVFSDIFLPEECIREENDYGEFSANQTGGRMLTVGPDRLLFSTGEWRVRDLAQDPESLFGKVVEIDLTNNSFVVKSMGHRNPQGLYHDPEANLIVVSEHGPEGGDEININRTPDGEIENYGWPVSSYGEHYDSATIFYEKAPLHKSHADYGFIEPDRYYTPSISPTQVLRLADPKDPERYALLLGAMGFDYREGDQSVHILDLDGNFEIASQERITVDDRVRDMVHIPRTQSYVLFLEGNTYDFGTVAILTLEP